MTIIVDSDYKRFKKINCLNIFSKFTRNQLISIARLRYYWLLAGVLSTGRSVGEFTNNMYVIRQSVYANTADDIHPEEL